MFSRRRIIAKFPVNRIFCRTIMKLQEVVCKLNKFAPPSLAESWDNVGLLLEPSHPHEVNKIILTNDLTLPVLEEALDKKADMILSYHPPIFSAVKKITASSWKNRIIVKCLENRIAVYSPHTCYDALQGGVNDWLASAFPGSAVEPIEQSIGSSSHTHKMTLISKDKESLDKVSSDLTRRLPGIKVISLTGNDGGDGDFSCSVYGYVNTVTHAVSTIKQFDLNEAVTVQEVIKLEQLPLAGYGMGRVCKLQQAVTLSEVIDTIKGHLGLQHVRVALGDNITLHCKVKTVALCAGSGSSVLKSTKADVFWTGEMSHHEVLDAVARGTSAVLCEHSNTERGYLTSLQPTLQSLLEDQVDVVVSERDRDPLRVM